jgi:hypothetical protein
MHKVIIVPGLSDNDKGIRWATKHWKKYGLDVVCFPSGWQTDEDFQDKLKRLISLIEKFIGEGDKVSLVGTSAGGSLVLNAFLKRRKEISKVVNICGRLRKGNEKGFRSFKTRTQSSNSFRESVQSFERRESLLTVSDRKKIMIITPKYGDELVPYDTAILAGAYNLKIPTIEHVFSIGIALRFFKPILCHIAS